MINNSYTNSNTNSNSNSYTNSNSLTYNYNKLYECSIENIKSVIDKFEKVENKGTKRSYEKIKSIKEIFPNIILKDDLKSDGLKSDGLINDSLKSDSLINDDLKSGDLKSDGLKSDVKINDDLKINDDVKINDVEIYKAVNGIVYILFNEKFNKEMFDRCFKENKKYKIIEWVKHNGDNHNGDNHNGDDHNGDNHNGDNHNGDDRKDEIVGVIIGLKYQ